MDEESDTEMRNNGPKKMTRSEALQKAYWVRERKFKCRNCEMVGHFTANCPTLSTKEKDRILKTRERNKAYKEKDFPIDLKKRIKESPCGLTMEEAIKIVLGYKREFSKIIKVVKKGERELNYMGMNHIGTSKKKFTPMNTKIEIEDVEVKVIFDMGAAIGVMTSELMKELGYKIDKPSKVMLHTEDHEV